MRIRPLLLLLLATTASAQTTTTTTRPTVLVRDALCVSQSDGPFLALAPEGRDAYLAALGAMGWKLMRTDVTWSRVQPAPPPAPLDFSAYDDLVARAAAHDVRLLGILDYGVDWASHAAPAGDDHYPPDDPKTFATFAGQAARRYRGHVPAWEVWNEENNGFSGFWKPSPDAAAYAKLAMVAARAIHRGDPKATIVTGGLAPTLDLASTGIDYGFFTAATKAVPRWLQRFKAAAVHPYTFLQAPAPEIDDRSNPFLISVARQLHDFRNRVIESRASRLPVWVTELGWHTAADSGFAGFPPGVSELDQARYLVRATVIALAQRAERVCWYTLLDYPNELANKEDAFGLFRYVANPTAATLDPKPAYRAAQVLAQVLGPTRWYRDLGVSLGLPPGAYAFAFRGAKPLQTVVVLWSTTNAGVTASPGIDPTVKDIRRIEMDGTETDLGLPESGLEIPLGPTPVYLVFQQSS